jgi:diaminopimelate decarboxylase
MNWEIKGYREAIRNHLLIDGVGTLELAREFGTPLFLFSESRIRTNIENLRQKGVAAHPRVKICYAAKANSILGILRVVRDAGCDVEVNSGGELFKAIRAGFRPSQIVFNGVSKTAEELEQAIKYGIYSINVDSRFELELIEETARRVGKRANVAIRIVPEIETRTHAGLQTALLTSKFGVSRSQVLDCLRRALKNPTLINLAGIHIHVGSQTPDVEPYANAFALMADYMVAVYKETGHRLSHVNLGGGIPVVYLHDSDMGAVIGDKEREMLTAQLDVTSVVRRAIELAGEANDRQLLAELLSGLEIVFEPGRSIIADAGTLLTTIRNLKTRPETGDTWLLVDAGYELLLSMSNYKWYYHVISAGRASGSHRTPYKVAGPLCDGGDVYFDIEGKGRLPDHRLLPQEMKVGDTLAVLDAGAYTTAQMSAYNGRPFPAALLIQPSGKTVVIRKRDTYEDLVAAEP